MEAGSATAGGDRSILERSPLSQLPDKALRWGLTALAALILALIGYFFIRLYIEAKPAFDKFGVIGFTFDNNWDVSRNIFGALPLLVGTLITSVVALAIGVPIAVATAVYVVELCHRRHDAGPGSGDRRDHRGDTRDRQRAGDRQAPLLAGLHAGRGDRERVRRGGVQPGAPRGPDRGGARPLRPHPARQRRRARLRR